MRNHDALLVCKCGHFKMFHGVVMGETVGDCDGRHDGGKRSCQCEKFMDRGLHHAGS